MRASLTPAKLVPMTSPDTLGPGTPASHRRRCNTCGLTTTPAAMAMHLKHRPRHTGWTDTTLLEWAAEYESELKAARARRYRRRSCDTCGMVTVPGGMSVHQRHTGHTGWTHVDPPLPRKRKAGDQTRSYPYRKCSGCGLVTVPGGLASHQKILGHSGWTPAEKPAPDPEPTFSHRPPRVPSGLFTCSVCGFVQSYDNIHLHQRSYGHAGIKPVEDELAELI